MKIFGNVKWVRDNLVGIQFEEKLPKSVVLDLRGEVVDPETLAEMEAMLAARNWVIGTPMDRSKTERMADVLGRRKRRSDQSRDEDRQAQEGLALAKALVDPSSKQRAAILISLSASLGLLVGLGSILIF
jgi:hypothetical protein